MAPKLRHKKAHATETDLWTGSTAALSSAALAAESG